MTPGAIDVRLLLSIAIRVWRFISQLLGVFFLKASSYEFVQKNSINGTDSYWYSMEQKSKKSFCYPSNGFFKPTPFGKDPGVYTKSSGRVWPQIITFDVRCLPYGWVVAFVWLRRAFDVVWFKTDRSRFCGDCEGVLLGKPEKARRLCRMLVEAWQRLHEKCRRMPRWKIDSGGWKDIWKISPNLDKLCTKWVSVIQLIPFWLWRFIQTLLHILKQETNCQLWQGKTNLFLRQMDTRQPGLHRVFERQGPDPIRLQEDVQMGQRARPQDDDFSSHRGPGNRWSYNDYISTC